MAPSRRIHLALLISALAALAWSGFAPHGRFNWFMETLPALIGGTLFILFYRLFAFTTLCYSLAWIFALILMTGGHYTYAQVPIGNWARDAFHLSRNHFDRLGHVFQGVIPAMLAREVILRTSPLRPGKWLMTFCISFALAVSALYELFEWCYAVSFGGQAANDFLGSQGDIWDAQEDMFMALCGAIASQLLLSRWHDRQMMRLLGHDAPRKITAEAPSKD